MNKKTKLLSTMLCSLILSSGLTLTSVHAAPIKTNNVNTSTTNLIAQSTSQSTLLRPQINNSGVVSWNAVPGASQYKMAVLMQYPNRWYASITKGSSSGYFPNNENNMKWCFDTEGTYYITVIAMDSNGNNIQRDLVVAYYDGSSIHQVKTCQWD
ncbi:hypothetical protein [Clostridium scatologenes]|nr:hypothetical protein [Clostridium scatologenes]